MGVEELDFEIDLTENEAADDWLRARRLRLASEVDPIAKEEFERMENQKLVRAKES